MEETLQPLARPPLPDSRDTPSMEDPADTARPGLRRLPHSRTESSEPRTRLAHSGPVESLFSCDTEPAISIVNKQAGLLRV